MPEAARGAFTILRWLKEQNAIVYAVSGVDKKVVKNQLRTKRLLALIQNNPEQEGVINCEAGEPRAVLLREIKAKHPGHRVIYFDDWFRTIRALDKSDGIETIAMPQGEGLQLQVNIRAFEGANPTRVIENGFTDPKAIFEIFTAWPEQSPTRKLRAPGNETAAIKAAALRPAASDGNSIVFDNPDAIEKPKFTTRFFMDLCNEDRRLKDFPAAFMHILEMLAAIKCGSIQQIELTEYDIRLMQAIFSYWSQANDNLIEAKLMELCRYLESCRTSESVTYEHYQRIIMDIFPEVSVYLAKIYADILKQLQSELQEHNTNEQSLAENVQALAGGLNRYDNRTGNMQEFLTANENLELLSRRRQRSAKAIKEFSEILNSFMQYIIDRAKLGFINFKQAMPRFLASGDICLIDNYPFILTGKNGQDIYIFYSLDLKNHKVITQKSMLDRRTSIVVLDCGINREGITDNQIRAIKQAA